MKLTKLGNNETLLTFHNGSQALFIYQTAVAGYNAHTDVLFKTNKKYSVTTNKHINSYLNEFGGYRKVAEVSPEDIERFVELSSKS